MTTQLALELRAEGQRAVTDASDELARNAVDQAIRVAAESGDEFSIESFRHLLPDVRPRLIGARFTAAATANVIEPVMVDGTVKRIRSSLPSTRGATVVVWRGKR